MGLFAKVAKIDREFSWSFFGFVLAAIFGGIAIYTEFIRNTNPVVKYEIIGNTKILDVKEDVSGLSIIYNAEDIKKARKTLSVLVVKISNEGRSPILKTSYDSASPLGFSINSGEIIKAEVIAATTDYLRQNAGIRLRNPSNVEFCEVIIEPNESFTAKLLILSPEQSIPTIFPKGKVARVKNILLADSQLDQRNTTFVMKAVGGSLWVQLARIPIYAFAFILLLVVVVVLPTYISGKWAQIKKYRIVRQFKSNANSTLNELNPEVFEFYKHYGLRMFKGMRKVLANDKKFQTFLNKSMVLESGIKKGADLDRLARIPPVESSHYPFRPEPLLLLQSMLKLGLVSKVDGGYAKNDAKIRAMNEFIHFVETKEV